MPHFIIEYSANLESQVDMTALCRAVLKAALATGVFEIGAVRVRAIKCEHYAIADDKPENAFIDASVRGAKRRTPEQKKAVGEAVMAAMASLVEPLFKDQNFALSVEVRDIDPDLSWRRNSLHERLREPAA
jgi:5-carboxymethyl-2-hydroxymuconate isomerase